MTNRPIASWSSSRVALTALQLFLVTQIIAPWQSSAVTFTVSKAADTADGTCDADCSLREAVNAANALAGPDTIDLPTGTYALTIANTAGQENAGAEGDLDISGDLTLIGNGPSGTIIDGNAIDGVLHILTGVVDISRVTIRNGNSPSDGGGVLIDGGTVTIDESAIVDNGCAGLGGGIQNSSGSLTVSDSTVSGNTANAGGGIGNFGPLTLTNTTVSGNSCTNDAGGIGSGPATIQLQNVTVTNNAAGTVGGGLELVNANVTNSIIAGNFPTNCTASSIGSSSYSLDDDGTCSLSGTGDVSNAPDAGLGTLQDNGGSTETHALCTGAGTPEAGCAGVSPALDTADPAAPGSGGGACESNDQRGRLRPGDGDGNGSSLCDMGAHETLPTCPPVPLQLCRGASKSVLVVKDNADDSKDKLVWKWIKGAETAFAAFGTPTVDTPYAFCLYDGNQNLITSEVPPAGTCDGKACWKQLGSASNPKGFKYKDKELTPDGVKNVLLKAGAAGKAKSLVKGKGANLLLPPLGVTPDVTAQLINQNGECWAAVFTADDLIKNDGKILKGKVTGLPGILPTPTPASTPTPAVPPVAVGDPYDSTGNVGINVPAGSGVLANDTLNGGSISAFDAASSNGGDVTMNTADGAFTYDPPAGFEGVDTFTYTLINGAGTSMGTVTVTVSDSIWFIDNSQGAGDGRLNSPFNTLAAFDAINGAGGSAPAAGDAIFLYETASGDYTGGVTLENTQALIGQGAGATLASLTGITPPVFSNALPATGGSQPTLTNAAGNGIDLGTGNLIRGLDIGATSGGGTGINGAEVGTLSVGEVGISGPGGAVDLSSTSGAAIAVTLSTISIISSAREGIRLSGVSGSFSIAASDGTITTSTTRAIDIDGDPSIALSVTLELVQVDNSAPNGIVLTDTTGSFTVSGGATPSSGSGGFIMSTTDDGVSLTRATNVSLNGMIVDSTGAHGIDADTVDGLTVTDSDITGAGDANEESGVFARELTGTVLFEDTEISDMTEDGIDLENTSGVLSMTLRRVVISDNVTSGIGENGMTVRANGTASMSIVIEDSTFDTLESAAVNINAGGSSTANYSLTARRTTFDGAPTGDTEGVNGLLVQATRGGASTSLAASFLIENNNAANTGGITNHASNALTLKVDSNGLMTGSVISNDIDGSETGVGIDLFPDGNVGAVTSRLQTTLNANRISNTSLSGIFGGPQDGNSTTLEATLACNLIEEPTGSFEHPGISISTVDAGTFACLNVADSTGAGLNNSTGASSFPGFRLGYDFLELAGSFRMQGMGSNMTGAGTTAFIDANNTSTDLSQAFSSVDDNFTNATCTTPAIAPACVSTPVP